MNVEIHTQQKQRPELESRNLYLETLDVVFFRLLSLSYHLSCIRPVPASHRESDWHGFGFPPLLAWRLACVAAPPPATHMSLACCQVRVSALPLTESCHAALIFFPLPALTHTHAHTGGHTCEPAMVRGRVRRARQTCASSRTHTEELCFCL